MKIYVDEDMSDGVLVSLLQKAGHDVETALGAGRLGQSDPVQFTFAIHEGRAYLSANYDDYEELHLLVKEAKGQHPGVLIIRQDNDPSRDLTPKGIVTAFRKLEAAGVFQGTAFGANRPIPNLARPAEITPTEDDATRSFLRTLNEEHARRHPGDTELTARIASYELAGRMQLRAAEVADLSREPRWLLDRYGCNEADRVKAGFARNCVLARRLLEADVRFVQLFNGSYAMGEGVGNWDGHRTIKTQYDIHGPILDQPCAALVRDLKQRGLLSDTLVVWVTEFGRMPTFQLGASGRDHNPHGFTVWLAGAGVKRGLSYGTTDEFGYRAEEPRTTIYDLHATILHLLGLDHERLSFYHNGIERRLTDVHGQVLTGVLA